MKKVIVSLAIISGLTGFARATMVEFVEDGYAVQAPKEITDLVQEAAEMVGYDKPYEVVIPKEQGLQVNPWNRFICSGSNTITHNWFVSISPEWFSALPQDQQLFLIGRCFMVGKMGLVPPITAYIPWLFVILSWVMIYILYRFLLSKTSLKHQPPAIRVFIAFAIAFALNVAIINKIQIALLEHLYRKHDTAVAIAVIEKTGNHDAAVNAIKAYDGAVKKSVKEGEARLAPFEHVFEQLAQSLTTGYKR